MSEIAALESNLHRIMSAELEKGQDNSDISLILECSDSLLRMENESHYQLTKEEYRKSLDIIFFENKHKIKPSKKIKILLTAAIILLLTIISALGLAQKRYDIFNFDGHGSISTEKHFHKLKEGINAGYIPDGFVLVAEDKGKFISGKTYKNGDKILDIGKSSVFKTINIDTVYGKLRKKEINGTQYFISGDDENFCTVIWFIDDVYYNAAGNLPENELIKIAENIM